MQGETLERVADLITEYNRAFLAEKEARERKALAGDALKDILQREREREVTLNGFRVLLDARLTRSISVDEAQRLLEPGLLRQLLRERISTILTVTPVREGR